ncbi:MAG TPA: hypothetical protein VMH01_11120 [Puia sp.]|nr:hypothetical protein [Puia sp.]
MKRAQVSIGAIASHTLPNIFYNKKRQLFNHRIIHVLATDPSCTILLPPVI